ncbi:uncharacterized protein Z520_09312 [Fonsecaea multimorphosa CBS 102226]|uniref:Palmitoyltransferase n=1 Tax=Fonsecaea multimorphosa CBS 102226 TaxID=1442371 RepID=A0A0D2JNV5_9EURO|nr:uncharacterized protein Z520_09312 [Fonsecaea multimorphosa CBS 102226]KIX95002.1 hypothetical protein Z520_09312 [Fonsecaea multimorphosa CBS 102226]OAL20650.1 hypothetical protein AYO22_08659 [Fonsecaea multimorphosa]
MKTMRPGEANKRGNVVTARIIPVFLLGIIGYSSWVLTDLVGVKYLIHPKQSLFVRRETGSAIAILVIFYLLLLVTLTCFGRLAQTILTNPGLVPRGEQYWIEKERKRRKERRSATHKEEALEYDSTEGYTPRNLRRKQDKEAQQGFRAQDFWHKDVFVCGWDGRPPFCSTCYNYKPDRAHHCSELGRCVLKMDHFCPWVGGIVSETSFKYFIQFTGWAALFCLHTLVVMAYYFARRRSEGPGNFLNVHWILVLIFAGLFFIFTAGMCGSSLQFAFLNSSTIENFTRKTKIWYLAVYLPPRILENYQKSNRTDLRLITYPRPPEEQFQILKQHGASMGDNEENVAAQSRNANAPTPTPPQQTYDPQSTTTFPPAPALPSQETPNTTPSSSDSQPTIPIPPTPSNVETRVFAILESPPGGNPFDIGAGGNFREVMGYTVFDWFFPLRASPLTDHSDPVSMYKVGSVVERMKRKAGIQEGEAGLQHGRQGADTTGEKRKGKTKGIKGTSRQVRKKNRRRSHSHSATDGNSRVDR